MTWQDPVPFLRGTAWLDAHGRAVRADPADLARLPWDTAERAALPIGVRLEFTASPGTRAVQIRYRAAVPDGTEPLRELAHCFALWAGDRCVHEAFTHPAEETIITLPLPGGGRWGARAHRWAGAEARAGSREARAEARAVAGMVPATGAGATGGTAGAAGVAGPGMGTGPAVAPAGAAPSPTGTEAGTAGGGFGGPFSVHPPESQAPVVLGLRGVGGTLFPAPPRPRWLVHGDSITEGWWSTRPAHSWPAVAGRALGLDTVNLGYAGSARGELAIAQQLAALPADLLTLAFGTNCWSGVPHTAPLLYETTRAFITLVRQGHPDTPLLLVSPLLRPEAEATANDLGATLAELRTAMEEAARDLIAAGDARLSLLPGRDLLGPGHLADGLHPDDAGHARVAAAVVAAVAAAVRDAPSPLARPATST
ncbi:GDSL family lipase [Streptomyces sp. CB03234]|uniref:GDSL-type esterase/lipase family protein n=1 Tax=Streptomyces sp. (strain CB03234) TaxID=1703937 RepID=UPI0009627B5A|nr:GDSL-type esterase/lipase family protein [Streptomyces sp. CB03234]OKJ96784.1 GDSL family lipase [Streptomyces sp. CB03234]